jgi:hypothetical protein
MSKQDLKSRLAAFEASIGAVMAEISGHREALAAAVTEHEGAELRLFVRVARDLFAGSALLVADGQDWRPWARTLNVASSDPTLYRIRNAGAVADILGDSVGDAFYTALVPLYRFVNPSSVKTEKDQAKGRTALISTWKSLTKDGTVTPDPAAVIKVVDKKRPAKKGPPKNASAESSDRNDPTATTETETKTPMVEAPDTAAIEAASSVFDAQVKGFGRKGISEANVRAIFSACVRMSREHGIETVAAVLGGVK